MEKTTLLILLWCAFAISIVIVAGGFSCFLLWFRKKASNESTIWSRAKEVKSRIIIIGDGETNQHACEYVKKRLMKKNIRSFCYGDAPSEALFQIIDTAGDQDFILAVIVRKGESEYSQYNLFNIEKATSEPFNPITFDEMIESIVEQIKSLSDGK